MNMGLIEILSTALSVHSLGRRSEHFQPQQVFILVKILL